MHSYAGGCGFQSGPPGPPGFTYAQLGGDAPQRHIPGLGWDRVEFLTGMGDPQQIGLAASTMAGEGAVIVAAAHAEAVALTVETDQRQQHQVEPQRRAAAGIRARLRDAEAIGVQRAMAGVTNENQGLARV